MAKTFMEMAQEAMAEVSGISPTDAQRRLQEDTNALLIDVRDAADIPVTGLVPGGLNISLGNYSFISCTLLGTDMRPPEGSPVLPKRV